MKFTNVPSYAEGIQGFFPPKEILLTYTPKQRIVQNMNEEHEDGEDIEFTESAFRHNISKKDIKHALKTKILDVPLVRYPQKNALIGFDQAGNLLEILYNEIDDFRIEIFHAMKARKTFLARLGLKEKP